MKYKRIMVAVDESETSILALKEAIQLTKDLGSTLRVIHVIDENIVKLSGIVDVNILDAFREQTQQFLKNLHNDIKNENINFDTHLVVLKGNLAAQIIKEAEDWQTDLLVIGTHGRSGFNRFFLGSVAERIARIASLPVLLIRRKS